jgi:hypothetical protein
MTGFSLHMQWPLTSQSHGSVSQREQSVFHYGLNSTPLPTATVTTRVIKQTLVNKNVCSNCDWHHSLLYSNSSKNISINARIRTSHEVPMSKNWSQCNNKTLQTILDVGQWWKYGNN